MKHRGCRYLIPLVLALLSAGCATNSAGIAVRSDSSDLRVDSSSVAKAVNISQVRQRSVAGVLQGSALISSTVSSDRYWQYKFTFFDLQGLPVELDSSHWQPLNLHGGEQRAVQAAAANASAASFELSLRPVTKN
ncbi:DUF1425 domain-containing protein [uncultured Ferrimonas sp.]|uniref:DUF1425 domain-containing protein n=1 Tax=uncultured Ferrimonas sp. TaxID=432640 RepID=UPI0026088B3B|nr:DUF1425 domain-containing protein [uncultured Ferrimonas sp.]